MSHLELRRGQACLLPLLVALAGKELGLLLLLDLGGQRRLLAHGCIDNADAAAAAAAGGGLPPGMGGMVNSGGSC